MKAFVVLVFVLMGMASSHAFFFNRHNPEDENTDNSRGILTTPKSREIYEKRSRYYEKRLSHYSLSFGSPIYIRAFKAERLLELWMQSESGEYLLYKKFQVCKASGTLGPKFEEGDDQVPEGFYQVGPQSMNPKSRYHLSFNIGFPNEFDQYHQRTGSYIMIHGRCKSSGCLAMKNEGIEKIYTLAQGALLGGQETFRVDIFPFKMTEKNMTHYIGQMPQWRYFWKQLKEGYDFFEERRYPGQVSVHQGRYFIQ